MASKRPVIIWENYYCQIARSSKSNFLLRVPLPIPPQPPPVARCWNRKQNGNLFRVEPQKKLSTLGKTLSLDQRKKGGWTCLSLGQHLNHWKSPGSKEWSRVISTTGWPFLYTICAMLAACWYLSATMIYKRAATFLLWSFGCLVTVSNFKFR